MLMWRSFVQYIITTYTVSFLVSLTGPSKTMTNNCYQQQLPSSILDFTGKASRVTTLSPVLAAGWSWMVFIMLRKYIFILSSFSKSFP